MFFLLITGIIPNLRNVGAAAMMADDDGAIGRIVGSDEQKESTYATV